MASIAAQAVAQEVVGMVGRGKRPNITKIAISKGYSPKSADRGKVQQTKSYKAVIFPYAERLKKHQEKILRAMEAKDLTNEDYKVLADSLSKVTHDVQLLTGKSTENVQVRPIMDVISENNSN